MKQTRTLTRKQTRIVLSLSRILFVIVAIIMVWAALELIT